MPNTLILQASSRSNGHSATIARMAQEYLDAGLVDLRPLEINPYSYDHAHTGDDFLPLMRRVLEYETIIFVTPVYWYAMSGILKNFFDRITDCLKIEKAMGRRLRGMGMAAIACGSEEMETEGFFVPFRLSAEYLGMRYLGDVHTWMDSGEVDLKVEERLRLFSENLLSNG